MRPGETFWFLVRNKRGRLDGGCGSETQHDRGEWKDRQKSRDVRQAQIACRLVHEEQKQDTHQEQDGPAHARLLPKSGIQHEDRPINRLAQPVRGVRADEGEEPEPDTQDGTNENERAKDCQVQDLWSRIVRFAVTRVGCKINARPPCRYTDRGWKLLDITVQDEIVEEPPPGSGC